VDSTKSEAFTATYDPASQLVSSGVMTTAATVETAVMRTESATSAPAMSVTKLDAVPPGAQPTRISPAANSGPRPRARETAAAVRGITVYCTRKPNPTY
jgi:hypothetical protein